MNKYEVDIAGKTYEVDAPDPQTAWVWANQYVNNKPAPKTGLGAAAMGTVEGMLSTARTGIGSLFGDPNEAARAGVARGEGLAEKYAQQTSLDAVKKAYEERGVLGAGKEVLSQVPAAIAEQLPRIATTAGGAQLGGALGQGIGSLAGPVGAGVGRLAGTALGAAAPTLLETFGVNLERQAQEQKAAGAPIDVSRGAAAAAAVPAAALDTAAMFVPLGRGLTAKLLGVDPKILGAKAAAEVEALAKEGLTKAVAKGLGTGALAEVPTEVVQQMLERAQAGLPLTGAEAFKEYGEAAYGAGLVAPLGAVGRLSERSGARDKVAADEQQRAIAAREAAAQATQQAAQQEQAAAQAAEQRAYAEKTGAPLLAGALPEEDPLSSPYPPTAPAAPTPEEIASVSGQRMNLYREVETLKEQIAEAAKKGDTAAVREQLPRLKQMSEGLTAAEAEAKRLGLSEITESDLPAEDVEAASLTKKLAGYKKALVKAGDLGDFDALDKLTTQISEAEARLAEIKTQPDLFGVAAQEQQAAQQAAQAEQAAARQKLEEEAAAKDREAQAAAQKQWYADKEQAAAQPAPEETLLNQLIEQTSKSTAERQQVAGVPPAEQGLTPEQRGSRIESLAKRQERTLLQLVDTVRDAARLPAPNESRIALSDRRVAQDRMMALRDAYIKLLLKQAAEQRAQRGAAPLTNEELLRTLPVKGILDEMIQRALALPTKDVVDPLGLEVAPKLRSQVTNRPPQPEGYVKRAQEIQARMAEIYRTLQTGTNDDSKARLREEDARLAKELFDIQEKFRGDPEFTQRVDYTFRKARTDPRPLTERPFRRVDASVEALLADLEDARGRVVGSTQNVKALSDEAERIENLLSRLDDRSQMRIGQQAGTTQEKQLRRKQMLENRLMQIQAFLAEDPTPAPRNVKQADISTGLAPQTPGIIAAKDQREAVNPRRGAIMMLDRALSREQGPDVRKTLEAARAALANSQHRKQLIDEVTTALGTSDRAQQGNIDPTVLRPIEEELRATAEARRDDTQQGDLFDKEPAAKRTIRADPRNFLRLIASKLKKAASEEARARARVEADAAKAKADAEQTKESQALIRKATSTQIKAKIADIEKRIAGYDDLLAVRQQLNELNRDLIDAIAAEKSVQTQITKAEKDVRDAQAHYNDLKDRASRSRKWKFAEGEEQTKPTAQGIKAAQATLVESKKALARLKLQTLPRAGVQVQERMAEVNKLIDLGINNPEVLRRKAAAEKDIAALRKRLDAMYQQNESEKRPPAAGPRKEEAAAKDKAQRTAEQKRLEAKPTLRVEKPATKYTPVDRSYEGKVVLVEHVVKKAGGGTETRMVEVPVVPAVYTSGKRIGTPRLYGKDKKPYWKPRNNLPPSILAKVKAALDASGGEVVVEAGKTEGALPLSRLVAKKRLVGGVKKVEAGLPKVSATPGVKQLPKKGELRGARANELRNQENEFARIDKQGYDPEAFGSTADFRVGDPGGGLDPAVGAERMQSVKGVEYYPTLADAPAAVRSAAEKQGVDPAAVRGGVMPDGTVFVVGENHKDVADLERTVAHEVYGHKGFEGFVGPEGMKSLLSGVEKAHGDVLALADSLGVGAQARGAMQEGRNAGLDEAAQRMKALKEVVAYTEEARVNAAFMDRAKTLLKEMVGAVRSALKKMGLVDAAKMSTSDLFYLMRQSRANFDANKPLARMKDDGTVSFAARSPLYADGVPDILKGKSRLVGMPTTAWQKMRANASGLAFRVQFVDKDAAMEEVARIGVQAGLIDSVKATDLMYFLRMHSQRNAAVAEIANSGTLKLKPDAKTGELMVKSERGANLKAIAEALAQAKVGNETATNLLFTKYLLAERALGKDGVGIERLNFHADFDKAELEASLEFGRGNAAFQEARALYRQYNNGLIEFARDTGAITADDATAYMKGDYVPYYRQRSGVVELVIGNENPIRIGAVKDQPYLQELVGGEEPVLDFFTSALQNTAMLTDLSLRNLATRNVGFILQSMGIAERVGSGAAGTDIIRAKIDGKEQAWKVDTEAKRELFGDIPSDLLVKGMEGIHATIPAVFRMLGVPAQLLRKFVTRDPRYAVRQVVRDSLTGLFVTGANYTPITAALKELGSIVKGTNTTEQKLQSNLIIGGQVIAGMPDDMQKILQQISSGKKGWDYMMAKLDAVAMAGDAATRVNMYNSFLRQGLSEREATLATLQSMNFNQRGVSPSMYMLNTLIPFFNAQVVGLDVLYRALTGRATAQEKLRVKQKLYTRGAMLGAMTLAYAAAMDGDDAYENATGQQRLSNWFVYLPGVDQPVRVPIPFEIGLLFKALPEAIMHAAGDDAKSKQVVGALGELVKNSVPGMSSYFLPQAGKPVIEMLLNKQIFNGAPIVPDKLANLPSGMQYDERTSGFAKTLGEAFGVSPKQVDHLINGYTATLGLGLVRLPDFILGGTGVPQPDARASDYPIIGGLFQPKDSSGVLQLALEEAKANEQAMNAYKLLVAQGNTERASAFAKEYSTQLALSAQAGKIRQQLGEIHAAEAVIRAAPNLSSREKREQLDQMRQLQLLIARQQVDLNTQIERRAARP